MSLPDAELLHRLVAIPSPTGSEAAAVAFMQDQARADGLRVRTDAAGNFLAEAGRGKRLLLLVGHIDTVPGHIPVRVEGGELWGRGSVDAKGPLAAFYAAARRRLEDADLRILLVGAVDEEGGSKGAKALPRDLRPDWILVGEPSGADGLTVGYKGILRGTLGLERPHQHGGHAGPDAVTDFLDLWAAVRGRFAFQDGFDVPSGRLDEIHSRHDGLADRVEARFQVRLPPSLPPAEAAATLDDVAQRHHARVHLTESMPAILADRRNALAAAVTSSIRDEGLRPHLKRKTGTADMNHLAQWHPGVPIAAYGPGDSALDHTPEERIHLEEFARSVRILDRALGRLAAAPQPVRGELGLASGVRTLGAT